MAAFCSTLWKSRYVVCRAAEVKDLFTCTLPYLANLIGCILLCPRCGQLTGFHSDTELYIGACGVPMLPGGSSALEYARELDRPRGNAGTVVAPTELSSKARDFVSGNGRLLVILGDAGTGKSMFLRMVVREYRKRAEERMASPTTVGLGDPVEPVLLPLLIVLKARSLTSLEGLVVEELKQSGWTQDMIDAFAKQELLAPTARLLVLCDGFDELEGGDVSQIADIGSLVCHGIPPTLVSLILTSRESRIGGRVEESRLFGCAGHSDYGRIVILPFSRAKVPST